MGKNKAVDHQEVARILHVYAFIFSHLQRTWVTGSQPVSVENAQLIEWLQKWKSFKFRQKLGNTQVETIRNIQQTFGNDNMNTTQIKEWYNNVKDGCTLLESGLRSAQPWTSWNDKVTDQLQTGYAEP